MNPSEIEKLQNIKTLPSLIKYLRDDLDWPISPDAVEDDIAFEYSAEELGLGREYDEIIREIKQIRPLDSKQPWGIFWINFDKKRLPVVILRRILGHLVVKRRASANKAKQASWQQHDLMFISSYGEEHDRAVTFVHFSQDPVNPGDLPALKVLGWDGSDTVLHLADARETLKEKLRWPDDPGDLETWRKTWSSAFSMRHREVITTTEEMVEELARLAAAICKRTKTAIKKESEKGPLRRLYASFKASLIHDLDEDGFADVIAQTISYGLLTAKFSRPAGITVQNLVDMVPPTNPFLRELLGTFLHLAGRRSIFDFDELGIQDVVDLLNHANTEAVKNDFGNKSRGEDPVIHFYEHFLSAYNKEQKIRRGVFYTPQPVVSYIVRSVHELLQTEFGLEDGLASTVTWHEMAKRFPPLPQNVAADIIRAREPESGFKACGIKIPEGVEPDSAFVQILDPATGTATFLVEVIDVIHKTMIAKWEKQGMSEKERLAAWNKYVPEHLLTRLHGYELMMAPYAIAHMKIGLKLFETGYQFMSDERARIYLTNALEPPQDFSDRLAFDVPALAHEAQAVNAIKRHQRFTVVIGNPPYGGHSVNNHIPAIVELVHDYKRGLPELDRPGQGKWLQDDYVKFIRLAESILELVPAGLLGYITNHSFLDNTTFKGMRRHLLDRFSQISLVDLHGNAKKKERTRAGDADENVFEIQQGVAIMLACRGSKNSAVQAYDLSGKREQKYSWLIAHSVLSTHSPKIDPVAPLFLFRAQDRSLSDEYDAGIPLPELMAENGEPAPGLVTTHDEFAISWSAAESVNKVESLLKTKSEAEARNIFTLCSQNQWNYARAKRALADGKWRKQIVPILYRPFDFRWTIYNQHVAVHRRERVMWHMLRYQNLGIICTRQTKDQWGVLATRHIVAHKTCGAYDINFLFPLNLLHDSNELNLGHADARPNFSPSALRRMSEVLSLPIQKMMALPSGLTPEDIFHYIYAVFHSPGYRSRYAEFLKIDFPRLPLTSSLELFRKLEKLGGELVALHLMESPKLDKHITKFVGDSKIEIEKVIYSDQTVWVDKANTTGFKGVPENVWNFHIGGYQASEKWLKDRKGRKLSKADIEHYHKIVVALSETIRLMAEIDKVIDSHGGWPGAFLPADENTTNRNTKQTPKKSRQTALPLPSAPDELSLK